LFAPAQNRRRTVSEKFNKILQNNMQFVNPEHHIRGVLEQITKM